MIQLGLCQNTQIEKKELMLKHSKIVNENKKLTAENKVLDKALTEGIGRKAQQKLHQLQKQLELAQLNEKASNVYLEKLAKEVEALKIEKEAYQNLVHINYIMFLFIKSAFLDIFYSRQKKTKSK